MSCSVMETGFKESIRLEKPMAKVLIPGGTARPMTVNGLEAKSMATVFGEVYTATVTSGNGQKAKPKDMVCTPGLTATDTKVNGRHVSDTVTEQISSPTAMST